MDVVADIKVEPKLESDELWFKDAIICAFDLILGLCILDEVKLASPQSQKFRRPAVWRPRLAVSERAFTKALEAVPKAFFSSVPT